MGCHAERLLISSDPGASHRRATNWSSRGYSESLGARVRDGSVRGTVAAKGNQRQCHLPYSQPPTQCCLHQGTCLGGCKRQKRELHWKQEEQGSPGRPAREAAPEAIIPALPSINSQEIPSHVHKRTCSRISVSALFAIAKINFSRVCNKTDGSGI